MLSRTLIRAYRHELWYCFYQLLAISEIGCLSVIVTDLEAHHSVQYLQDHGVNAGPCGAAPLAALRKLHQRGFFKEDPDSVVVLFSTEGNREYVVPV